MELSQLVDHSLYPIHYLVSVAYDLPRLLQRIHLITEAHVLSFSTQPLYAVYCACSIRQCLTDAQDHLRRMTKTRLQSSHIVFYVSSSFYMSLDTVLGECDPFLVIDVDWNVPRRTIFP